MISSFLLPPPPALAPAPVPVPVPASLQHSPWHHHHPGEAAEAVAAIVSGALLKLVKIVKKGCAAV